MSEVLMVNMFFVITGIAIVVASTLLFMVLYQVWRITRVLRRVTERIEEGAARIAEDAAALKKELTGGKLLGKLVQYALSIGTERFEDFVHSTVGGTEEKKKKSTKVRHTAKRPTKRAVKKNTKKSTSKKKTKMKIKNLD